MSPPPRVAVIDYGIGNLLSVSRAFEHCGAEVTVTGDPAALAAAPALVLPGVGAFEDGMSGLRNRGLDSLVVDYAASGKPLLGICLGMQMLATVGEEFGEHAGLGIIPGRVRRIPVTGSDGRPHKIPHVGWADLELPESASDWTGSPLEGLRSGEAVYVTHSFAVYPDDNRHRLADYIYDGVRIAAAIRKGNVTGVQFHPEKSAAVGLRIIANFIASISGDLA
jgi:imidazole glycerol-phosphate synthase subunit HisH